MSGNEMGVGRCKGVSTLLSEVIKSPADKREYRAFTLRNEMTVIVISDPGTDKAAAALSVLVGSLHDPVEIQGLAHYLEHMLFLGTAKFPQENAYAKYLAENAGCTNAYTTGDNTCYYFDCSPTALEGAVDRFAQFFICPLFTESGSEREVNAVNSEHEGNVPDDDNRKYGINSFLTKKFHPFSLFSTGNKYTLWTRPMEQGIDVRTSLLRFYKEHYSANLMKLAVIGRESCDELQKMVETYFLEVENYDYDVTHWMESPFGPDELKTKVDILPIMDIRILTLIFPTPDYTKHYKSGALSYLKSLVGHEGPGSLLSLLKKKNWATDLSSSSDAPGRGFAFIIIQIDLTPLGLENIDDIIKHFFQYMEMIRQVGPQQWYWEEIKKIKETAFRFQEDQPADFVVVDVVDQMSLYPVEHVWTSRYILDSYKPELIIEAMNRINPNNVRVVLQTKANESVVTETEEFYGAKYRYQKLPEETVEKWINCGVHEELHLPFPNTFIPQEFELKPRDVETGIIPRIILDDELSRVWFLQDNEFKLPRGILSLDIMSSRPQESPKNLNLIHLFEDIIEDLIAEDCYSAYLSGLGYAIYHSISGLRITVSGYNDKLEQLFYFILNYVINFTSAGHRFEVMREAFIRDLQNWKDEEPAQQSAVYMNALSVNRYFSNAERLDAVHELTPENLVTFIQKLFSSVKLQWYICGNYTEQEALAIHAKGVKYFEEFGSKPVFTAEVALRRQLRLPSDCSYLYSALHTTHSNSCTRLRLQLDMAELHQRTIMLLIDHILAEPCFDILRTKEQLGYYVGCSYRQRLSVMSFEVIIQGEKHPIYLENRIEKFLEHMMTTINGMGQGEFDKYVSSLRVILSEKPKTLNGRFGKIDSEIVNRTYEFDADEKILQELETVTLAEIRDYFRYWITPGSDHRKKLVVHVTSVAEGGAGQIVNGTNVFTRPSEQELITDIEFWKRRHGYFPAPVPRSNIPPWKSRSPRKNAASTSARASTSTTPTGDGSTNQAPEG